MLDGATLDKPTVADLLAAEKNKNAKWPPAAPKGEGPKTIN